MRIKWANCLIKCSYRFQRETNSSINNHIAWGREAASKQYDWEIPSMGKYLHYKLNYFLLPYLSILYRIAAREGTSSLIARSLLVYTLLYTYRVYVKYVFPFMWPWSSFSFIFRNWLSIESSIYVYCLLTNRRLRDVDDDDVHWVKFYYETFLHTERK